MAVLELRDVAYRYPGATNFAIEGVDLTIEAGDIVGVVGPNDAGKSTLCLVASGLAPASTGGELTGRRKMDGEAGVVFQDPAAQRSGVTGTVFEEVAVGPVNLGRAIPETIAAVRATLRAVGIDDLAERHPARLSGGQAQLLAIASTLAMGSRLLVLDEPTAQLDPDATDAVVAAIRALALGGTAVLIAEHRWDVLDALGARRLALAEWPARAGWRRHVILCEGITFTYPDGATALTGLDLEIGAGERVAITGRNGSGKSTLVRHWNGLLRPTAGQVLIDGRPTEGRRVADLARTVGMSFQDPGSQLFARTCREEVEFGARNVGLRGGGVEAAVEAALAAVGLTERAGENPYDIGLAHRKLLAIASVLAMRTPVVVLDEPTPGQDADGGARLRQIVANLASEGRTVVAISHDGAFIADSFERVVVLDAGRVIADGSAAALREPDG